MFGNLFKKKSSPEKIDDSVRYFFKYSLYLLSIARKRDYGTGEINQEPIYLSEKEKYDYRNNYIAESGIENYGVWFFSRVEVEATSFTNYHIANITTFHILEYADPYPDFNSRMVIEVKNFLSTII